MPETTLPGWLIQSCSTLPCGKRPIFFSQLWAERRLQFHSEERKEADVIDELSARLACAALSRRERLLIVLPDRQPRRPALLFATALIMHALNRMLVSQTGGQVLYFGSSTGIRSYLRQTSVGRLALDTVFPQVQTIGRTTGQEEVIGPEEIEKLRLPQVACVYSPADPVSIVHRYPADWIAIDCGDGAAPPWLTPVLSNAYVRGLPVVAWCQNLLSDCAAEFARAGGRVFRWPETSEDHTNVIPILLDGAGAEDLTEHLESAQRLLIRATRIETGRLGQEAVRLGWAMLRSIEGLAVPLGFYEAEVGSFWGLRSVTRLREGFGRFLQVLMSSYPALATVLEEARMQLERTVDRLRASDPPLWTTLTELCIADVPSGMARVIVFPGIARKQLFSFALLARHNITEEDLRGWRIWICSLKELYQAIVAGEVQNGAGERDDYPPKNLRLAPVLVGVPSLALSTQLTPIFRHAEVEVLLYPHQGPVLARRADLWKSALEVDLTEEVKTLRFLGGRIISSPRPAASQQRISMKAAKHYNTGRDRQSPPNTGKAPPLWQPIDPVEEVKWLLQADNDVDEERLPTIIRETREAGGLLSVDDSDTPWVEEGIAIRFAGGWHVLFGLDDTIQAIVASTEGDILEERYVRSLRVGDHILFIHGQRRQSLYELIVARTHRDPAVELHLALIQRWRDDFQEAYRRQWHWRGRSVEDLLRALQARGSRLIAPQTVRSWLRGHILCPDDPEDLRRLAEELNLAFVRQHYLRIYSAAQRIAGLHRRLALRLNHRLRHGLFTGNEGADDVVDQELGLTFRDFRDSLMVLRVDAIEPQHGPFFRKNLGQLERSDGDGWS